MDLEFIFERITQLRLQKGVTKQKMSRDLGHGKNYIYCVTTGRIIPSIYDILKICDYFGITPLQFFDVRYKYPTLIQNVLEELRDMDEADILLLLRLIKKAKD